MKGKINKEGVLEIWRKSKFKPMECRYGGMAVIAPGEFPITATCGDDCSQFGDPDEEIELTVGVNVMSDGGPRTTGRTYLKICKGRHLVFDEFEDERE